MKKLISFCLPCYNVESYLHDCIKSIKQQYLSNDEYEIICVDDCSTDKTYSILKEIEKNSINVIVLKNEKNTGVSFSRNKLIQSASGKYIWFVDPDDLLCPNRAKLLIDYGDKLNADVLLGNYERICEDYIFMNYQQPIEQESSVILKNQLPTDKTGQVMNSVWGGIYRRDFLLQNQLFFNEKMIAQEDTLFFYQMMLRTESIYKINNTVYLYRQRKTSVMHNFSDERNKKYYLSMMEMLRVYMEHYKNGDYNDEQILQHKILHSKQNIATTLASLRDKKYIKEQLKILKRQKIYPYPFRKDALKGNENLFKKLLRFLMPIKLFFWLYHMLYIHKKKA